MQTSFHELYDRMLKAVAQGDPEQLRQIRRQHFDAHQVDCLLHPHRYAPVWQTGRCDCGGEGEPDCVASCLFRALRREKTGEIIIDRDLCTGCSACIDSCKAGKLYARRDISCPC
jgi:Fe-S-cluster-containing dehydrogenase component